jgi:hypothetical protein
MTNILLPENAVSIYRGVSKTLKLTVAQTDEEGEVVPVDLTGASIYFTVKRDLKDTIPVIKKSTAQITEVEITDAYAGEANIFLNPLDTQNLEPGQYLFDVLAVLASGKRYVVVKVSIFEVLAGVTVIP